MYIYLVPVAIAIEITAHVIEGTGGDKGSLAYYMWNT